MESIKIYPKTEEQLLALQVIAASMQIEFELGESPYDANFVAKVLDAEKERNAGKKGTRVDANNLWEKNTRKDRGRSVSISPVRILQYLPGSAFLYQYQRKAY